MRLKTILISVIIPILAYNGLLLINSSHLRQAYIDSVSKIPDVAHKKLALGEDLEQVTRWAVDQRNRLKSETREKGGYLDKSWAEQRNLKKYNNKLGPSYTWLFNKVRGDQAITPEEVNRKIIAGAGKTNAVINQQMKQKGWLGIAFVIIVLCLLGYRIYTSPINPKRNIVIPELGRVVGGLIGGSLGVHLGVAISQKLAYPNQLANFGMVGWLICCVLVASTIAFTLKKLLQHAPKSLQSTPHSVPQKESVLVD
ncbi:MAG: hypothetical protein ACPGJS_17620 [Flammeovirgaceae bacterium]